MKFFNARDGRITIYYCKAGIQSGRTVRVIYAPATNTSEAPEQWDCKGVRLTGADAEMLHDNSTGKPKKSGARCVMYVTGGEVEVIDGVKR
jgi:hypothetical protein